MQTEGETPGSQLDDTAIDAERQAAQREVTRAAGRMTALLHAASWSIGVGLVTLVSAVLTASTASTQFQRPYTATPTIAPPNPPPYLLWLLLIGGACWAACTVVELRHASRLGGDYPPHGPWTRIAASPPGRLIRKARGRVGTGGCLGTLTLATIALAAAWAATTAAAPLWIVIVGFATLVHLTATLGAAASSVVDPRP